MMSTADHGSRWEGRRRAREAALQMLYQTEIGRLAVTDALQSHGTVGGSDALALDQPSRDYAETLARGAWEARAELDDRIGEAARNWRVERMAVIDRLILRLAVHELMSQPGTPPRVVIDEAIDLARAYSGEDAAKFVNGVLDGVFKKLKEEKIVLE